MFGLKFKSWMESHIVRSRKKGGRSKEGGGKSKSSRKGTTERSLLDSLGNSLVNRFHNSKDRTSHVKRHVHHHDYDHQALSGEKKMDTIALPSQYSTGNNLSSPESAYSTGYSTDGTSPGTSFPPEYYINIRTGTHYFHSGSTASNAIAIPSAIPPPKTRNIRVVFCDEVKTKCVRSEKCVRINEGLNSQNLAPVKGDNANRSSLLLRSNTHRRTESCGENNFYPASILTNASHVDDTDNVKNYMSPILHSRLNVAQNTHSSQAVASPRQRNRIRTNPWLTSNHMSLSNNSIIGTISTSSINGTSKIGIANGLNESHSSSSSVSEYKSRTVPQIETSSYGSTGDITLSRIVKHHCEIHVQSNEKLNEDYKPNPRKLLHDGWYSPPCKGNNALGSTSSDLYRCNSVCSSGSSSSSTPQNFSESNSSTISEDDLTLNEMLGKYDESYVYEKETDILSDSDPTDCDGDCVDTDFDTGQDGGDEHDTQDDEDLDFIDTGSFLEYDASEVTDKENKHLFSPHRHINKGHCTYIVAQAGPTFSRKPSINAKESNMRRSNSRRKNEFKDEKKDDCKLNSQQLSIKRKGNDNSSELHGRKSSKACRKYRRNCNIPNINIISNQASHVGARALSDRKKRMGHRHFNVENKNLGEDQTNSKFSNDFESITVAESSASTKKGINMNQILMKRILHHVNERGSRSAGNTPIPIRRRLVNGNTCESPKKDLIPQLISENTFDSKKTGNYDESVTSQLSPEFKDKTRSFSVSYAIRSEKIHKIEPDSNSVSSYSSEIALIEADKEAHQKYKELILEAEHILVSMKETETNTGKDSVAKAKHYSSDVHHVVCHESDTFKYPKFDDRSKNLKISLLKSRLMNSPKKVQEQVNYNSTLKESRNTAERNEIYAPVSSPIRQDKRKSNILSERIVHTVTKQAIDKSNSGSSSSDSDGNVFPKQDKTTSHKIGTQKKLLTAKKVSGPERPPLVTFQSIDLGHSLDDSGYCPQSEPVKRKVYTCSATFDKLQKSLEKSHNASLRYKNERKIECTDHKANLKEKLELLRREREQVESKVREAKEEEQKRLNEDVDYRQHLSSLRRQMLLHTIEGLKRSLEDQSAKLQETYEVRTGENVQNGKEKDEENEDAKHYIEHNYGPSKE